jgi:hypothetical protein
MNSEFRIGTAIPKVFGVKMKKVEIGFENFRIRRI